MLSISWDDKQEKYDYVVVGSGYGGAIMAARLAAALPKRSLCILERGREWEPGKFPDTLPDVLKNTRGDTNPLGLYEFLPYRDISVIKGSGLGGTSLINANVAIVPDEGVFELAGWPRGMKHHDMLPYYNRARGVLKATPVPEAKDLLKVKALDRRAAQLGKHAEPLDIAVNFDIDGVNEHGMQQKPCTRCGDCVTGCNFHAKNTLYMNYLPMAKKNGADIFVQMKVTHLKKLDGGGWRVFGERRDAKGKKKDFQLDTKHVILSAGAINSTEILMRSEMLEKLSVSPALGTGFSGNGDFFGLAYNGDHQTNVLGYGRNTPQPGEAGMPGPSIVGIVRYNNSQPVAERITIEDFSFPSAYVAGAQFLFSSISGEDTLAGNEAAQKARRLIDANLNGVFHEANGALNHTMLYLVMGQDNARGTMNFQKSLTQQDGFLTIEWDQVGQQIIFRRMHEELRRHARALGANYIANPSWEVFQTRHLITAHPLGGCPMGEDYLHGAVDEWGRVFAGDGSVHDGLFVVDGALLPSALGVNPFLTISAVAERIAERKVKQIQGQEYPAPPAAVSMAGLDPLDVIRRPEAELEKLFGRTETLPLEKFVNAGGPPRIDIAARRIHNDGYWKGFFPYGHVLNAMSSAIFTGFKKRFFKKGTKFAGITNDTDNRITAHNSLQEVVIDRKTGTLEPGKYIHLAYVDPQWAAFYDIFKMINENLLIGRVYLGAYPNGVRLFTFTMTREYGFGQMTVDDHIALFESGTVPTAAELEGVWQMDAVSNNNHLAHAAMLAFQNQPGGKLEARYQLMGLLEGLVVPSFVRDHFQLNDFTPFHDEIRKVTGDLFVGRYIAPANIDLATLMQGRDLGILHVVPGTKNYGFYYVISKTGDKALPTGRLLQPFLDTQLPDGVGLTFDETMVGWYFEGQTAPSDKPNDLKIAGRIPPSGAPAGGTNVSFSVRMTVADVNEFVDGSAHEAGLKGTITFGQFQGKQNVTYTIDETASRFHYLIVNEASAEAEMRYHLEFASEDGTHYVLEGRKYMEKNGAIGNAPSNPLGGTRELLDDYTTLFSHIYRREANGALTELGLGYLKFRTFEDLKAIGNLAGFLASFQPTGTTDPLIQLRARMRFIAFTGQFVQREYDPLALPVIP